MKKIILLGLIIGASLLSASVGAQTKYQYISVSKVNYVQKGISYSIEAVGLDEPYAQQIKDIDYPTLPNGQPRFSRASELFNHLGRQGWELIGVVVVGSHMYYHFKIAVP